MHSVKVESQYSMQNGNKWKEQCDWITTLTLSWAKHSTRVKCTVYSCSSTIQYRYSVPIQAYRYSSVHNITDTVVVYIQNVYSTHTNLTDKSVIAGCSGKERLDYLLVVRERATRTVLMCTLTCTCADQQISWPCGRAKGVGRKREEERKGKMEGDGGGCHHPK